MKPITILIVLYAIATLDGMFSGICAASGRNALIQKRRYYALAMVHGALWAQAIGMVGLGLLTLAIQLSGNRELAMEQLVQVGERLVPVYAIYATIVLFAFVIRAIPSVDVRSLTSVMAFGPLTILRPVVIVLGAIWGLGSAITWPVTSAVALVIAMMLPFRRMLRAWFRVSPLPDQSF